MARPVDLSTALAGAAGTIDVSGDIASTLRSILDAVVTSLDGVDHAGITLARRGGALETVAHTDPLVYALDELQYELGEGPCVYAIEAETVVVVNHLSQDSRWPRFVPRAVELGLRAQIGLQLVHDEQMLGGLNLYSTAVDEVHSDVVHLAELFAAHAALALGFARRTDELSGALTTRKVIGQALGLVMAEYSVDENAAFRYLRRVSSHSNLKLRDVAAQLVLDANLRGQGDPGAAALDGFAPLPAE